jgi:site-specific recombinase XerD
VSLSDSKLFFIDPTLHFIAHLYCLGCFGTESIDQVFGQDVLKFPMKEETSDLPIFSTDGGLNPASSKSMNILFKKHVLNAGFSSNVTSYSMRHGFTRDLLASNVSIEVVKKLLHHTPTSTDAVC